MITQEEEYIRSRIYKLITCGRRNIILDDENSSLLNNRNVPNFFNFTVEDGCLNITNQHGEISSLEEVSNIIIFLQVLKI